jgi:hypothetical protein
LLAREARSIANDPMTYQGDMLLADKLGLYLVMFHSKLKKNIKILKILKCGQIILKLCPKRFENFEIFKMWLKKFAKFGSFEKVFKNFPNISQIF